MRRHYDLKAIYGSSSIVVESCREYFYRNLKVIENTLQNQDTLFGYDFGLADILLVTCLDWAVAYDFELQKIFLIIMKNKAQGWVQKSSKINYGFIKMGPLSGVKVIDLTSMVSGPMGAMMLADQGADVIKVEPIAGEQLRHMAAPYNGVNPAFFSCNRGKVTCD